MKTSKWTGAPEVGRALWILLLLFFISACAHYPVNPPLNNTGATEKEIDTTIPAPQESGKDLFLALAFSGGGTRAAAFAYGVLEALNSVKIPDHGVASALSANKENRTLLQEVDLISSVSGGSFTAAYYGLHGDRIFEDFKERFLTYDVQGGLLARILFNPFNWIRLGSRKFGRSDLAAEYYDDILFKGATFGDMSKQNGPLIRIQATDMSSGFPFGFTAPTFSIICSDLDSFPLSRAVAASAAFPGPFTPIVLKNYAGKCGFKEPRWIQEAVSKKDTASREYHTAKRMQEYFDAESKQYIHLIDGGVSDNLGVRGPTEIVAVMGGEKSFEEMHGERPRRFALIVVNASTPSKHKWRIIDTLPGLTDIIGKTSDIMLQSYNFETMFLLRKSLKELEQGSSEKGAQHPPIQTYLMEVGFDALTEKAEQMAFAEIPTSLYLPEDTVDRIRRAARHILFSLPEFKKLVSDLGGEIPEDSSE